MKGHGLFGLNSPQQRESWSVMSVLPLSSLVMRQGAGKESIFGTLNIGTEEKPPHQ